MLYYIILYYIILYYIILYYIILYYIILYYIILYYIILYYIILYFSILYYIILYYIILYYIILYYILQMTFPSGAVVTVNTYGGPQNIFLNLYIDIPSDYYNSTYGLCGTLDSNIRNELMDINGKYVAPVEWRCVTVLLSYAFIAMYMQSNVINSYEATYLYKESKQ